MGCRTHRRRFLACLLANTRRTASLSSSSASILISSSRASLTRSLSLLSTTKIRPETAKNGQMFHQEKKRRSGTRSRLTSRLVLLTLCVLKVVSPEGADLVLPTYIPHSEADVLVLHCFHVKPLKKRQQRGNSTCKANLPHVTLLLAC